MAGSTGIQATESMVLSHNIATKAMKHLVCFTCKHSNSICLQRDCMHVLLAYTWYGLQTTVTVVLSDQT